MSVLRRLLLQLLCLLKLRRRLLLIRLVILLLDVVLGLELGSAEVGARGGLGVESLVLVRTL